MAVVLRLSRHGSRKEPFYRLVAADKEAPRDGRFLEILGTYNPLTRGTLDVELKPERIEYWLSVGAKPSQTVSELIRKARRQGKYGEQSVQAAE